VNWQDYLIYQLKRHEGFRAKPYRCTAGVWTIGYGHTGGIGPNTPPIPLDIAEDLLRDDAAMAIEDARKVCRCFDNLSPARKCVIANMSFNLGAKRLAGFKRTLNAICSGDYTSASLYMLDSKWASQVGARARELAKMMSTGDLL